MNFNLSCGSCEIVALTAAQTRRHTLLQYILPLHRKFRANYALHDSGQRRFSDNHPNELVLLQIWKAPSLRVSASECVCQEERDVPGVSHTNTR